MLRRYGSREDALKLRAGRNLSGDRTLGTLLRVPEVEATGVIRDRALGIRCRLYGERALLVCRGDGNAPFAGDASVRGVAPSLDGPSS